MTADRAGKAEDGCGTSGSCRPGSGRAAASYAVKVSFPDADPVLAAAEARQGGTPPVTEVVRDYVEPGGRTARRGTTIVELAPKAGHRPAVRLVDQRLCAALDRAETATETDAAVAAALFDLVADCRHRLAAPPVRRLRERRIGLARVWLRRAEDDGQGSDVRGDPRRRLPAVPA